MCWPCVQPPETADGTLIALATVRDAIQLQMAQWAGHGWRVLGIASRAMGAREGITKGQG